MNFYLFFLLVIFDHVTGFEKPVHIKLERRTRNGPSIEGVNPRFLAATKINQTLVNQQDASYVGEIHIGTPPRKFVVDFDTGSDITWIASPQCHYDNGKECTTQKTKYSSEQSSTAIKTNIPFQINYGIGSTKGFYAIDVVGLTPNVNQKGEAKTFAFGLATKLSDDAADSEWDGIFGLSYSGEKGYQTYIEWLRDENVFKEPIFSVWMNRYNGNDKALGGNIIFGGKDEIHCKNEVMHVPTIKNDLHWAFYFDSIYLDGQKIAEKSKAVTDTGTSIMYVPLRIFNSMAKKYKLYNPKTKETPVVSCKEYENKILLKFFVGQGSIELKGKELMDYLGNDKCTVGIEPADDGEWLMGDVFIRSYCQIHNYKERSLIFAKAATK